MLDSVGSFEWCIIYICIIPMYSYVPMYCIRLGMPMCVGMYVCIILGMPMYTLYILYFILYNVYFMYILCIYYHIRYAYVYLYLHTYVLHILSISYICQGSG